MSPAKTAKSIAMPFGAEAGWPKKPLFNGGADHSRRKGNFWGLSAPLTSIFGLAVYRCRGRILTIYTSYDVFLRKEVPFWGHVDTPISGLKSP